MPAIMSERLAKTDAFVHVTEMVGSGPYRFLPAEYVSDARVVYERFADYRPREGGAPDFTAGPKIAHFDRVEWIIIPDASTAAMPTGSRLCPTACEPVPALEAIVDLDFTDLADIELPRGYGRD
jgi:peptide/nickel transport system substrate-binding protein